MRILVAFTFSLGGRDAYALGSSLANIFGCPLDLVTIVKGGEERTVLDTTKGAFDSDVVRQANEWMDEVISQSTGDITPTKNLRYSQSYPDGLLAAAKDLDSTLLVMGGGRHGALGKVSLGSIGNTLLHSSPIPVALAPRGMRHHPYQRLTRITAMLGEKGEHGAGLLNVAEQYSQLGETSLRLVSLVTAKRASADSVQGATEQLEAAAQMADLPADREISTQIAEGDNVEDAVASLSWKKHELALLGSGRFAQKGKLFLGSTANKILRVLPVPLIVVPSNWAGAAGDQV